MRLTYRTIRVLLAIGEQPGASNREIGAAAGIEDQGQISKLLARLARLGLIDNAGLGHHTGSPNEWALTQKGRHLQNTIHKQTNHL
jgi:DNA-binding MarR family transcriptional regulator